MVRPKPSLTSNVCSSCLKSLRKQYATTAASAASVLSPSTLPSKGETPSNDAPVIASDESAHSIPDLQPQFLLKAGVVLSRPPILTRDSTEFEKSYYFYQKRLNQRTALNFTKYFYFQPNTPQLADFKKKEKRRNGVTARDVGDYTGKDVTAWNDELLVGSNEHDPEAAFQKIFDDAALLPVEGETEQSRLQAQQLAEEMAIEEAQPRTTEADEKNDTKSLNRSLQRTLYLLVQDKKGDWGFPSDAIVGKESIKRAVERILVQSGGPNMNTWVVGHAPVMFHHHIPAAAPEVEAPPAIEEPPKDVKKKRGPKSKATKEAEATPPSPEPQAPKFLSEEVPHLFNPDASLTTLPQKTFFMRARMMAGRFDLSKNLFGVQDYKWLSKDEIKGTVSESYWKSVKDTLEAQ